MTIQENFSLKNHNTFGVDVSAKYFAEVHSVEELIEVLKQNPTLSVEELVKQILKNL